MGNYEKDRVKYERHDVVHDDARACRKPQPETVFFKVVGIDWNGFCPTESDERETDQPRNIEVPNRVQSQSFIPLRGRVAATIRHERVREFVKGQYDYDGNKTRNKLNNIIHNESIITDLMLKSKKNHDFFR